MLRLLKCLSRFGLDATHRRAPAIFLSVECGLECQLGLVFFELDLFVCSVMAEFWLVQILLYILMLLSKVLLHRTKVALYNLALNRLIKALVQMLTLEMFRICLLILAEPVIEDAHRHIFVIGTRLECALFHFFFFVLESNIFQFNTLLS